MKLDDINARIQIINRNLIEPANYPDLIVADNVQGIVLAFQNELKISADDFNRTILILAENNKSECFIAAEDFERVYKSTGVRERVNCSIKTDWNSFSQFFIRNEMISFYLFDEKNNWCAWFNDNYVVITFKSELKEIISSAYSFEKTVSTFSEANQDFIHFLKKIYKIN